MCESGSGQGGRCVGENAQTAGRVERNSWLTQVGFSTEARAVAALRGSQEKLRKAGRSETWAGKIKRVTVTGERKE